MQLKRLIDFFIQQFRQETGAIAVMFAIISPLLLMFYSMAFDGANMQASRARLADGLNQGILAVAMVDNRNSSSVNKAENIQLLRNYLEYYLPNAAIPLDDLDIAVALNYTDTNELKSVDYSASGKAIVKPSLGTTVKAEGRPGFDPEVDIWASGGVVRKSLEKIKYPTDYVFVVDFSGSMLESSAEPGMSRIKLLQKIVTAFSRTVLKDNKETTVGIVPFSVGVPVALNKKNLMGGNELGCSYVGKLKSEYKDVDLNFLDKFSTSSSAAGKLLNRASYHWAIANVETLDFDATLADGYMFSEKAVTTYIHHYLEPSKRPLKYMCQSAALDVATELPSAQLASMTQTIDKPASYLIELTSNPLVLDEFADMKVVSMLVRTDSSSGLLRSLPVIAKGINPRKIIIVVSDGDDNGNKSVGPRSMTNKLHMEYGICDRIKQGLLKYPVGTETTQSDIYFISVVDDKNTDSRINFWADYCVGKNNTAVATDYQSLMNTLMGIAKKVNINFINKDEK